MDRLCIPVIILHLSIVAKIILLQRSHNYGVWNYWQQKLLYCICYTIWIDWHMIVDSNRRVGVWSLSWRWHILSIPLTTGRGTGAETCGLDDVFPPDDLCCRPEALLMLIYIYIYALLDEFCYRTYIYIQQQCHSVLVKLHPITFYRTVFLGAQFLGWMTLFCFLWFTNCVLLSDDNSLTHFGLVSHISVMKNSSHFLSDAFMRRKSLYPSKRPRGRPTKQCQAKMS